METIYNTIRKNILEHPKVKNSVLGKVNMWKRSHYIILSEIIKEELAISVELQDDKKFEIGNTISHITLQRFFEHDYQYKTHNDLRFLKTLDKICIFLGFKDLNSYIEFTKQNSSEILLTEEIFFKNLVYNYAESLFKAYSKLPKLDTILFKDILFDDSPLLERLKIFGTELSENKIELITKNNRSNYEIFDIHKITEESNKKILETHEFWNLVFKRQDSEEEYFINLLNTQVYFIHKINDTWMIWDCYNPNAGEINETIKKP